MILTRLFKDSDEPQIADQDDQADNDNNDEGDGRGEAGLGDGARVRRIIFLDQRNQLFYPSITFSRSGF